MARKYKGKSKSQREPEPAEVGLDEVDEFEAENEKVMLDEAGWNTKDQENDDMVSDEEEEVMAIDDNESSDEEIERLEKKLRGPVLDEEDEEYFNAGKSDQESNDEDDDDEGWGASSGDYYGADDDETEGDAKAIEEEALRIQKKHLEELAMDDYMVDEAEEEWNIESKEKEEDKIVDANIDFSTLNKESQIQLLETTYPEFIPLTKEIKNLKPLLTKLISRKEENELLNIKYSALSSYLGTIGTYFTLFLSNLQSGNKFSMKDEPIMASILSAREMWRQAKELPDVLPTVEDYESTNSESEREVEEIDISGSDMDEEEEDEEAKDGDDDESEVEETELSKKRIIKKLKTKGIEDIDEIDSEDKKGRRKTLRFYTSKIDQQENKRDGRFQGDQDLPYRERLFERQQRLLEEARKRGDRNNLQAPGADLGDDDDFGPMGNGDDEYYNNLKAQKSSKKLSRKSAHSLAVKAAKEGKLAEMAEDVDQNGKRAINYQILKNKGLTPHRKKDDRNARVKKRKKYATAQKKLKSVRAVYQTPSGPYSGETTGIKKNLSKSVKLR